MAGDRDGRLFELSENEAEFCRKAGIPAPQLAAEERLRQLFSFGSLSHLFYGCCCRTGRRLLTFVPPELGRPIVDVELWASDEWDATVFGRPYDFTRGFFEQFRELLYAVPLPNLAVSPGLLENSDFVHGIVGARDCYLCFGATGIQDCFYSRYMYHSRDIVDCLMVFSSELCCDCFDIRDCYNLRHSEHCENCSDSCFLSDCCGCRDCYGCVNLRNCRFHYFNAPLSEDAYRSTLAKLDLGSARVVEAERKRFHEHRESQPRQYYRGVHNEQSYGDFLRHTRNCRDCFYCSESENLDHCVFITRAHDCIFFASHGDRAESVYNSYGCGSDVYDLKFCSECFPDAAQLEYCVSTSHGARSCFGCVGLRRKSCCILNRQYSKRDYEEQTGRIRRHMRESGEYGCFFPPEFSPVYFNHSQGMEYFPLSREEALRRGYRWKDEARKTERTLAEPPDNIVDFEDADCGREFRCELSGQPFKVLKAEAAFYRRLRIPPPRIAPLERIRRKASLLEICAVNAATCASCGARLRSVYAGRAPALLCESCFRKL